MKNISVPFRGLILRATRTKVLATHPRETNKTHTQRSPATTHLRWDPLDVRESLLLGRERHHRDRVFALHFGDPSRQLRSPILAEGLQFGRHLVLLHRGGLRTHTTAVGS